MIKNAMLAWLRATVDEDARTVLRYEEDTDYYGNGCETCEYSEVVVKLAYLVVGGETRMHKYSGDFAGFIRTLDAFTETYGD